MLTAIESKMETFARVYSEDLGVQVLMGSCVKTDGKRIWIVPIPDQSDEWVRFMTEVLVYHETGHIKFTNMKNMPKTGTKHSIFNAVEDVRIEKKMQEVWVGMERKWARFMTEFTKKTSNQNMADPNAPMLWKITATLYARAREVQLKTDFGIVLPKEVEALFQKHLQKFVVRVAEATTQEEALKLTEEIYEELKMAQPPKPKQKPKQEKKNDKGSSDKGREQTKPENDNDSKDDQESEPGDSDGQDSDDQTEGSSSGSPSDSSGEESIDNEHGDNGEGEDEPQSGEQEDSTDTQGTGSTKDSEDSDQSSSDVGTADSGTEGDESEPDTENSEGSSGSGSGRDDSETENQSSDGNADGKDNDEIEDEKDSSETDDEDGDAADTDAGDTGSGEDIKDDETSEGLSDTGDEDAEGETKSDDGDTADTERTNTPLTEEEKEIKQSVKDDTQTESISDELSQQVNQYAETHKVYREPAGLVDIIKEQPEFPWSESTVNSYEEEGRKITGYQGARLRTLFISERAPKWQTNLKSGRLDTRKLWNENSESIFRRKSEAMLQDSAVSLVIDNSGSMDGDKARIASQILTALGSELDHLRIPFEACGFTTQKCHTAGAQAWEGIRSEPIVINQIKRFEESYRRVRYRFVWPDWSDSTIEYPCIRHAAIRLAQRRETKKVLFILSDGATASGCATLDSALRQATKELLERLVKVGFKVVGFGIMDDNIKGYCKDSIIVDDLNVFASEFYMKLAQILLTR